MPRSPDPPPPWADRRGENCVSPRSSRKKSQFREDCRLTTGEASGIMQSNFKEKPLNKRSKRDGNLSESRGWWDHGRVRFGEWTCEGRANRERSHSSEDGGPHPLSGRHVSRARGKERALTRQLGWYRRMKVLSHEDGMRLIFLYFSTKEGIRHVTLLPPMASLPERAADRRVTRQMKQINFLKR